MRARYLAHFALAALTAVGLVHNHQAPHAPIVGTQAIVSGVFNEYHAPTSFYNSNATVDMHCYYIGNLGIPASEKWWQCYILKAYDAPPFPNVAPTTYYSAHVYDVAHATQRNVDSYTADGWTCRNLGLVGFNTSFGCVRPQ